MVNRGPGLRRQLAKGVKADARQRLWQQAIGGRALFFVAGAQHDLARHAVKQERDLGLRLLGQRLRGGGLGALYHVLAACAQHPDVGTLRDVAAQDQRLALLVHRKDGAHHRGRWLRRGAVFKDAQRELDADCGHGAGAVAQKVAIHLQRGLAVELQQHIAVFHQRTFARDADRLIAARRRRGDLDAAAHRDAAHAARVHLAIAHLEGLGEGAVVAGRAADHQQRLSQHRLQALEHLGHVLRQRIGEHEHQLGAQLAQLLADLAADLGAGQGAFGVAEGLKAHARQPHAQRRHRVRQRLVLPDLGVAGAADDLGASRQPRAQPRRHLRRVKVRREEEHHQLGRAAQAVA